MYFDEAVHAFLRLENAGFFDAVLEENNAGCHHCRLITRKRLLPDCDLPMQVSYSSLLTQNSKAFGVGFNCNLMVSVLTNAQNAGHHHITGK